MGVIQGKTLSRLISEYQRKLGQRVEIKILKNWECNFKILIENFLKIFMKKIEFLIVSQVYIFFILIERMISDIK